MLDHQKSYLPSMGELFSSPKLRSLVNRWNPATVLGLAKNVLDEVTAEAMNAASEHRMPDISELSERIAAKLKKVPAGKKRPLVNATGVLFPAIPFETFLPLKAMDRMIAALSGESDITIPNHDEENGSDLESRPEAETASKSSAIKPGRQNVVSMICELTDAPDAVVVNTHAGALTLAVCSLLGGEKREIVANVADFYETTTGYRNDDLLNQLCGTIHRVGTVNQTTPHDYAGAITGKTALVYASNGADACFFERRNVPELAAVAGLARKSGIPLLFDAEWGTFHPTDDYGLKNIPTFRELLKQGSNLLVFQCGLLNGCDFEAVVCNDDSEAVKSEAIENTTGKKEESPLRRLSRSLAVIAGDKARIRAIRKSPLFPMFLPVTHEWTALETVLGLFLNRDIAENEIPIWQLLATSCENLKLRADRIALQLAAVPGVSKVESVPCSAMLTPLRPRYTMPAWQVIVTHDLKTGAEIANALIDSPAGVVVSLVPDQPRQIAINLRTVFAKYDMLITEACGRVLSNE
ncbi:MAG: PLP-dependent transferase [Planctomycetaceae bacterium]|nr:PLP-dependent transferase [Planctomycetaceae bacterium]